VAFLFADLGQSLWEILGQSRVFASFSPFFAIAGFKPCFCPILGGTTDSVVPVGDSPTESVHRPGYLRARPFPFPAFFSNQYMILSGHDSADFPRSPIPESVVKPSRTGATLTPCAQNPAKKKGPLPEPPRAKNWVDPSHNRFNSPLQSPSSTCARAFHAPPGEEAKL